MLIEAAERAKEELEKIDRDIKLKEQELVARPQAVRQTLDDRMINAEKQIKRFQLQLIDDKEQFLKVEEQRIRGQESLESIKKFYQPQIESLKVQADYLPLAQRPTVSLRKRKKPKKQQQPTDDNNSSSDL